RLRSQLVRVRRRGGARPLAARPSLHDLPLRAVRQHRHLAGVHAHRLRAFVDLDPGASLDLRRRRRARTPNHKCDDSNRPLHAGPPIGRNRPPIPRKARGVPGQCRAKLAKAGARSRSIRDKAPWRHGGASNQSLRRRRGIDRFPQSGVHREVPFGGPMRIALLPLIPAFALVGSAPPVRAPRDSAVDQAPASRTAPDVERPLLWLIGAQNVDGSWGETAHSTNPDVATTAIAGIALIRMGHTGSRGEYQDSTRRAIQFVAGAVERTPATEIAVNAPGTLPQRKLGRNIDTFLAAQFLAEALPTLPRGTLQSRAREALAACARRIERVQMADGSYAKDGWAPLLASAFASNGLSAAQRAGVKVSESTLEKGLQNLVGKYDGKTK